jgi:hypothetical protein
VSNHDRLSKALYGLSVSRRLCQVGECSCLPAMVVRTQCHNVPGISKVTLAGTQIAALCSLFRLAAELADEAARETQRQARSGHLQDSPA